MHGEYDNRVVECFGQLVNILLNCVMWEKIGSSSLSATGMMYLMKEEVLRLLATATAYTLVNTKRRIEMKAPFVLASQAEQVFYVKLVIL